MKLQQLIHQVYFEPSIIEPGAHASIRQLLESRLFGVEVAREPGQGMCGEKVDVEQMVIENGIAHIPINGAIGQNLTPFDRGDGCVDVNDIADEVDQAESDPSVRAILMHFDSPGGMVSGTPELADKMRGVQKPMFAFTNGLMASAAYWLASATDRIFATKTANIGSIGVYVPFMDISRMLESKGISVDMFTSGKYKGMGFPGVPLSDAQREHMQARVNEIFGMFKTAVQSNRPEANISDDSMQGQTFLGENAKTRGLIDEIVPSSAALIRMLS